MQYRQDHFGRVEHSASLVAADVIAYLRSKQVDVPDDAIVEIHEMDHVDERLDDGYLLVRWITHKEKHG